MFHVGVRGVRPWLGGALAAIPLLFARSSGAHVNLLEPTPRVPGLSADPNADLKQAPCGQEQNGRSQNVNVLSPGETITVRFKEFTNHNGYYRVAFDIDGDDGFPTFPGPGTSPEGDDPTRSCPVDGRVILAYELADGINLEHTLRVKLPDVECENCTLQVIQYMYDTGRPYYYQCADLALRSMRTDAGTADSGAGAGDAGIAASFRAADSCSLPLPPRPRRDAGARPEPTETKDPVTSDAGAMAPTTSEPASRKRKNSGCSFAAVADSSAHSATTPWLLSLLALGAALSRRGSAQLRARARSYPPRPRYRSTGCSGTAPARRR